MYDEDQRIIELASESPRRPAWLIKEELGSDRSVRRIQAIINQHLGRRPTYASVTKHNVLREAVVVYMEAQGLNRFYCSSCLHKGARECAIRALRSDIDSFVFVCVNQCAVARDF